MTLLELLIAMSIMVLVVGSLGAVAKAVQTSFEYCEGRGMATQHARVALQRITRTVQDATANELFPGFIVLARLDGSWRFPDTLVVWHPDGSPADPQGLPRYNELVIYCPHPTAPNRLVEITAPNDTRTVPPPADLVSWRSNIEAIKTSGSSRHVTLTDLLRTGLVSEVSETALRGAARFESRLRPSQAQWESLLTWQELSWVQGIYGSQTGLRQAWLRIELQLTPSSPSASDPGSQSAIPFLGSAALYYEMHRENR